MWDCICHLKFQDLATGGISHTVSAPVCGCVHACVKAANAPSAQQSHFYLPVQHANICPELPDLLNPLRRGF